jgi:hypothetical protein
MVIALPPTSTTTTGFPVAATRSISSSWWPGKPELGPIAKLALFDAGDDNRRITRACCPPPRCRWRRATCYDARIPDQFHARVARALVELDAELMHRAGREIDGRQVGTIATLRPVVDHELSVEVQAIPVVALRRQVGEHRFAGAVIVPVQRTEYQSKGMPRPGELSVHRSPLAGRRERDGAIP